MKFLLTKTEEHLINDLGVALDISANYTESEALDILEAVYDLEVEYAQDYRNEREEIYRKISKIADKIHGQIPD